MNSSDLHRRAQKALACFLNHKREAPAWEGRKIVIYGAGGFGRDLARALRLQRQGALLGFLDQKGAGQIVLDDLPAHQLQSATAKRWLAQKPVVLLGVHNSSACLREIKARLAQFGFSTVITPMEAYPHLHKELGRHYWLGTPQDYAAAVSHIEQAHTLWADQESERLFWETLLFRLGFDLEVLAAPTVASCQYADPTVPPWQEPLRIVDGGAYTGDTLQSLFQRGCHFASIHAFEPDAENFKRLRTTVSAFTTETQVSLWPCGLWSSTCRMHFSEGDGPSSHLADSGPSWVPVVALDDVLHGQPVTLIKMDIEGAEPEALRGARRLIEKYRPGLAICLYHYPHHLWSIPLWVAGLNLDYRLYYRAHQHNTFETVLYATPQ